MRLIILLFQKRERWKRALTTWLLTTWILQFPLFWLLQSDCGRVLFALRSDQAALLLTQVSSGHVRKEIQFDMFHTSLFVKKMSLTSSANSTPCPGHPPWNGWRYFRFPASRLQSNQYSVQQAPPGDTLNRSFTCDLPGWAISNVWCWRNSLKPHPGKHCFFLHGEISQRSSYDIVFTSGLHSWSFGSLPHCRQKALSHCLVFSQPKTSSLITLQALPAVQW